MHGSLFRKISLGFTGAEAFEPSTQVGKRQLKLRKMLSVRTLRGKCKSLC